MLESLERPHCAKVPLPDSYQQSDPPLSVKKCRQGPGRGLNQQSACCTGEDLSSDPGIHTKCQARC